MPCEVINEGVFSLLRQVRHATGLRIANGVSLSGKQAVVMVLCAPAPLTFGTTNEVGGVFGAARQVPVTGVSPQNGPTL
jgi:hypothetical protein